MTLPPEAHRCRVFVVEDQPSLLDNLVKVLSLFPEIELVGTQQHGEPAVAQMVHCLPDVVLLDLELPDIDGIEVTRRLKRVVPEAEVLILTSFDDEQRVYQAMQAGASGYLVKRVGSQKIRSAIDEVWHGGTVLEAAVARRFWNYFQSVQTRRAQAEDPWGLSTTESEVLRFVAKGLSNAEVGLVMALERRSVRTHLSHIYRKMGVNSHVEAVVLALKNGVVKL